MPKRSLRDESGAIAIVVALFLPVMLGMTALVVDMGFVWETRRQMQNCVDAAALSASAKLPDQVSVYDTALSYMYSASTQGCLKAADPLPAVSYIDRNNDGVSDAVRIVANKTVAFGFAQLLGVASRSAGAKATGAKISPGALFGMEPFALQVDDDQDCGHASLTSYKLNGHPLQYGATYTIKYGAPGAGAPGNFGALALGGTGASVYQDNVVDGYQGWVGSCDTVTTEPGNMVGPTNKGLDDRLAGVIPSTDPWRDIILTTPPVGYARWTDSPRVINIALVPPLCNGRCDTQVLSFGWFLIESYGGQGNDAQLTGRLVDVRDKAAPPGQWRGSDPWDPNSANPWGVKLID